MVDDLAQTPRALTDPASLGLPPSIGGLVEFTSIADEVEVRFRLLARITGTTDYVSFLDYFDTQSTPAGAVAYSSFTGGFYWSNLEK